jgi:hypothetical protein
MEEWMKQGAALEIPAEALSEYGAVARWRAGWSDGLERYEKLWVAWRLP